MNISANRKAFLDAIAFSELGKGLLALEVGTSGYKIIVGSTTAAPILMTDFADHPRKRVWIPAIKNYSTAAGRYQILERYFDSYRKTLGLPDFGPASQDRIAMQMIKECGALPDIDDGKFSVAIEKCKSRWASLPGANYGQHTNSMDLLVAAYLRAGGDVA